MDQRQPASEVELQKVMELIPVPAPGEECSLCHRTVPTIKADDNVGPQRQTLSISIPKGEEGVLENMLIALVDKFQDEWPRDAAAMRQGVGLAEIGGRSWRYFALHFAVYACLTVPGLAPSEEG